MNDFIESDCDAYRSRISIRHISILKADPEFFDRVIARLIYSQNNTFTKR